MLDVLDNVFLDDVVNVVGNIVVMVVDVGVGVILSICIMHYEHPMALYQYLDSSCYLNVLFEYGCS